MEQYSFTNLFAWQRAHQLTIDIYKVTANFPSLEKYSLVDQMRRASISVTSNIAEAYGYQSKKMKLRFYFIANGSLVELQNQIILSKDLDYINENICEVLLFQLEETKKFLLGLIKYNL